MFLTFFVIMVFVFVKFIGRDRSYVMLNGSRRTAFTFCSGTLCMIVCFFSFSFFLFLLGLVFFSDGDVMIYIVGGVCLVSKWVRLGHVEETAKF